MLWRQLGGGEIADNVINGSLLDTLVPKLKKSNKIVILKKEVEMGDEPWVNYLARNTG